MAGVKRQADFIDEDNPSKHARTEDAPPVGTTRSYAFVPTTGPCYETPLDLRFPLHWSNDLFSDADFSEPHSAEIAAAESAVHRELRRLGITVNLATASEVAHIPGSRCPSFFQVEVQDGTKWDVWKNIQGTVFKDITKHFAHLKGFDQPVLRWSVESDNPYLEADMVECDYDNIPQRPPTSSAASTRVVTLTEAYIPSTGPPYETPLDLRFPLHWDHHRSTRRIVHEECSHEGAAEKAAGDDLWNCIFYPEKLYLRRCIAEDIRHYPEGISEPYFEVMIDISEAWSMDIHKYVVATIEKYFGDATHIIRYAVGYQTQEVVDSDDGGWEDDLLFD